jgi:hypothetical protein
MLIEWKRMNALSKYALGTLLAAGISYNANADFSLKLNDEFSGGQQPQGSVSVAFSDGGTDAVLLTITGDLEETEFMESLYLNFNPAYLPTFDATNLTFNLVSSSGIGGAPSVSTGVDAFKADGDGLYDILIDFDTDPPGDRFDNSDSVIYSITGITGLVADDFNFLSAPAGGHGPFVAAAHIQGVGTNGSGFVAPGVPDGGATVMLLGTALACLGALRRRFA